MTKEELIDNLYDQMSDPEVTKDRFYELLERVETIKARG